MIKGLRLSNSHRTVHFLNYSRLDVIWIVRNTHFHTVYTSNSVYAELIAGDLVNKFKSTFDNFPTGVGSSKP